MWWRDDIGHDGGGDPRLGQPMVRGEKNREGNREVETRKKKRTRRRRGEGSEITMGEGEGLLFV